MEQSRFGIYAIKKLSEVHAIDVYLKKEFRKKFYYLNHPGQFLDLIPAVY
jgi:hypothetical protein